MRLPVIVVNTLKFKVDNKSVKKTGPHAASTLAEFLEKDITPVGQLCSQESDDLRRLANARTSLVRTIVAAKDKIHALLLRLRIKSNREELPSKNEHG